MKRIIVWGILCFILLSVAIYSQETGHIQIKCEPGVQILMDGNLQGITNSDIGGLIIQNVPTGVHTIKAVKDGFQPQEVKINLSPKEVQIVTIEPFKPKIVVREEGVKSDAQIVAQTGTLIIQSLPVECSIACSRLDWNPYSKKQARLIVENIQSGIYDLTLSVSLDPQLQKQYPNMKQTINHTLNLKPGDTVELIANFLEGKVEEESNLVKMQKIYEERKKISDKDFTVDLGGGVTLEMVCIPGGSFEMGSPESEANRYNDEGPVHSVTLDGFWMGKYEVTQEQYEAVMGTNPSNFKGAKNPVEQVSWNDAMEFCQKLSQKTGKEYTLPTEAQWEYACRAGMRTRFSFGDSDGDLWKYGNYGDTSPSDAWQDKTHNDGYDKTAPVGSYKSNSWGLYDMHGNVAEWCLDWHDEGFYGKQAARERNPVNNKQGNYRVLRGGSWYFGPWSCRSAGRSRNASTFRNGLIGFRVSCSFFSR